MYYSEFVKLRDGIRIVSKMYGSELDLPENDRIYLCELDDFYEDYIANMNIIDFVKTAKKVMERTTGESFEIQKKPELKRYFYTEKDRQLDSNPEFIKEIEMPRFSENLNRYFARTILVDRIFILPKDRSNEPVELGLVFKKNPELSTFAKTGTVMNNLLSNISDEYDEGNLIKEEIQNEIFKKAESKFNKLFRKEASF